MSLPASGVIKFSDLNTAKGVGVGNSRKLTDMYGFATGVPASGLIKMSDLRGKSSGPQGNVAWAQIISNSSEAFARRVYPTNDGGVYVLGDAGFSDGTSVSTTYVGNTSFNDPGVATIVAKYNGSGAFQWAARISSTGTMNVYSSHATPTSDDGIIITGAYHNRCTVYDASGWVFTSLSFIPDITSNMAFVVKYTITGSVQWFTYLGENMASPSIVATADNGALVNVRTRNRVHLYNSNGTHFGSILASPNGSIASVMIKYNSSGTVQSVFRVFLSTIDNEYTIRDLGAVVTSDGGFCMLYSNVPFNSSFYNNNGTLFTTTFASFLSTYSTTGCVIKYSSSGSIQWISGLCGNQMIPRAISKVGNDVYVVGSCDTIAIFNGDGTAFSSLRNVSGMFLVRYNQSGTVQWMPYVMNTGLSVDTFESNYGVYAAGDGGSFAVGVSRFNANYTVYNANNTVFATLINLASTDVFLTRYNSQGNCMWATRIAGAGRDLVGNVCATSDGGLCVVGSNHMNVSFYNAAGSTLASILNSWGRFNMYIVKYL